MWYLGDILSLTMQLSCHRTVKQILKDYSTKIVGQTILPCTTLVITIVDTLRLHGLRLRTESSAIVNLRAVSAKLN